MIKHFILHEIEKKKGDRTADFIPSKQEVSIDSIAEALVNELHGEISNSSKKTYGVFSKAGTSYFKQEIDKYLSGGAEYDLLEKSKAFLGDSNAESLISLLKAETLSTGGHVLIIDYLKDEKAYITVTMINNKRGRALNIENGIPKIIDTEQIDFKGLDLACRIDINEYKKTSNDKNYICFFSVRDIISQYFTNFIGCERFNQNKDNSKKLVSIINGLTENLENREEIKKIAFDYCEAKNKTKSLVNLYELSSHLFGDTEKDRIVKYAQENEISIDHSFSVHRSEINRLINFKFKGDWIDSLSFDKSNIRSNMIINQEDDSVLFKNVAKLVKELQDEI